MTSRTVAEKMGIKPDWRTHVAGAPDGVFDTLGMPALRIDPVLEGEFDYVHLFVTSQAEMREEFPLLVPHVAPQGKVWLSWPKAGKLGSDLTIATVIEIGYDCGMVESTNLRIDDTWTGLRFTHPRPGKVYANSYGTLPQQRA